MSRALGCSRAMGESSLSASSSKVATAWWSELSRHRSSADPSPRWGIDSYIRVHCCVAPQIHPLGRDGGVRHQDDQAACDLLGDDRSQQVLPAPGGSTKWNRLASRFCSNALRAAV